MSDQQPVSIDAGTVIGEPRGTLGVERKVNLGNYETETISIFVQFPIVFGDEERTIIAANDAAFLAKSVVYAQLGVPVELQDGVLRVTGAFPGAVVQQAQPVAAPVGNAIPAQSVPTAAPSAPAAAGSVPVCPINPSHGVMYDNRGKNAERLAAGQKALPEARCRQHADPPKGVNCGGIIWSIAKGK